jgi:hypothetical protein
VISMSQWQQWLREFLGGWLTTLHREMNSLENIDLEALMDSLCSVSTPTQFAEEFVETWCQSKSNGRIAEIIGEIEEPDEETWSFLKSWFGCLMQSIETMDSRVGSKLLKCTGQFCACAHAEGFFRKVWSETKDLKSFLHEMNVKMCNGENVYRYVDDSTVDIVYPRCLCPLVDVGLIKSPSLCTCSSSWLSSNFENTLQTTVAVDKIGTVGEGCPDCRFRLTLSS